MSITIGNTIRVVLGVDSRLEEVLKEFEKDKENDFPFLQFFTPISSQMSPY